MQRGKTNRFTHNRTAKRMETHMSTIEQTPSQVPQANAEQPALVPSKPHGWALAALVSAAIILAIVIYSGIHERARAETVLGVSTERAAVSAVNIVHPVPGAASQEIVLPGNAQPFNDTPIYARTNGYLKRWYVDIGAHVKQGQLLAEIDTPKSISNWSRRAQISKTRKPTSSWRRLPRPAGRTC